jgi:hypothetical protein
LTLITVIALVMTTRDRSVVSPGAPRPPAS